MLTSITCPDSSHTTWTVFAGMLSKWLVQPLTILPILAVLFALTAFIPRLHGRRLIQAGVVTLALTYLLVMAPPTIRVAETILGSQIPHDLGTTADAIVVLGRGKPLRRSRVEMADQLWQAHRAPLIFASGVNDAPKMLKKLERRGVPQQALQGEDCSRTTYENAQFTAWLLQPQGVKKILLVTDEPHMLRSTLTFRKFGFDVTPVPSSGLTNLNRKNRTKLVLREYMGLASYGFLGRLSAPATQTSVSANEKPADDQPVKEVGNASTPDAQLTSAQPVHF